MKGVECCLPRTGAFSPFGGRCWERAGKSCALLPVVPLRGAAQRCSWVWVLLWLLPAAWAALAAPVFWRNQDAQRWGGCPCLTQPISGARELRGAEMRWLPLSHPADQWGEPGRDPTPPSLNPETSGMFALRVRKSLPSSPDVVQASWGRLIKSKALPTPDCNETSWRGAHVLFGVPWAC